jgi:hypothetical protein
MNFLGFVCPSTHHNTVRFCSSSVFHIFRVQSVLVHVVLAKLHVRACRVPSTDASTERHSVVILRRSASIST